MTIVQYHARSVCAILLMTLLLPMEAILAEAITFRFSGQIQVVAAELGDEVKIGDSCTVDVSFDAASAPVFAGLPWYPVLRSSFTIHASGGDLLASSVDTPREQIVINDREGAFQTDQWLWGAVNSDGRGGKWEGFTGFSIGGAELLDYNIHLTDNTATAFGTDTLPLSLDLASFPQRQGFAQFGEAGYDVNFSVESLEVLGDSTLVDVENEDVPEITEYLLNADGTFSWSFSSQVGTSYQIRTSADFVTWADSELVFADNETTTVTFSTAGMSSSHRFFSVVVVE